MRYTDSGFDFSARLVTIIESNATVLRAQGRDANGGVYDINLTHAVGMQSVVPRVGERWWIVRFQGSWILDHRQDETLQSRPSDGTPPEYSPTPIVIGGMKVLYVVWSPVPNNDQVVYEVHVSDNPQFVPSEYTWVGETLTNQFFIVAGPGVYAS